MFDKVTGFISELIRTKPLACFSIISFLFIIGRLYFSIKPLIFVAIILSVLLFLLRYLKKIDSFLLIFIIISIILGISTSSYNIEKHYKEIDEFDYENVRIEGTVASVPEKINGKAGFYLEIKNLYSNYGKYSPMFKVFAEMKDEMNLKYGDKLTLDGTLYKSDGKARSFTKHYLAKGAPFTMSVDRIAGVKEGDFPENIVSKIKNYILDIGDRCFSRDVSALFKALIAGDRSDFSDDLNNDLRKSGLSHIACVSGLHISILGMAIYEKLRSKNKMFGAVAAIITVLMFTLITGVSPSTVRAVIMFISFVVASVCIRESDGFTALAFSAMMLAIVNPYVIYDWGFILSFLSVLGIQVFSGYFKSKLSMLPEVLSDALSVTISAQIMTIPATVNMFGYISIYSVFANILVSVIFFYALLSCFVMAFVAPIPLINEICRGICTLLLYGVISVSQLISDIPMSTASVTSFNAMQIIAYYIIVLVFVFRKDLPLKSSLCIILTCVILFFASLISLNDSVKTYEISNESYVFTKKDRTVVLANDKLLWVYKELKYWNYQDVDTLIIGEKWIEDKEGLIDIKKYSNLKNMYIPKDFPDNDFISIAKRIGIEVNYYPEGLKDKEIYEFAIEEMQ